MKFLAVSGLALVLLAISHIRFGNGARILSASFMTSRSHKIVYDLLLNELAKRGHEVTILSPITSRSNKTNPREILTVDQEAYMDDGPDMFEMVLRGERLNPLDFVELFEKMCRVTYALPHVQEIMNQKFDLVFNEPFLNECTSGFFHKLNTTMIILTPFSVPSDVVRILGGPAPPSFIPNLHSPYENKMNFVERIKNFLIEAFTAAVKAFYFNPRMETVYREALNDSSIPGIEAILQNSSLTLSNSHVILGGARPFLPDVIEVGGMHMRQAKPLPKDLEDFAQNSGEHGFIFFSMGSILESSRMPETHRRALLDAFSRLKQKVLWKWETDSMPDLPTNVKLIKWAPQQDILGHPKIRAFITHGGLGSTTEAIYHGVPFIGIPMFGDQNTNIEKFMRHGIALPLDFVNLKAGDIVEAVETLISDPKYSTNVKAMAKIFRDQRDSPLERAVFWTEYVLRHQGAVHLRTPARDLNFFQYHSLDVISALLTVLFLIIYIVYKSLQKLFRICRSGGKNQQSIVDRSKKRN